MILMNFNDLLMFSNDFYDFAMNFNEFQRGKKTCQKRCENYVDLNSFQRLWAHTHGALGRDD